MSGHDSAVYRIKWIMGRYPVHQPGTLPTGQAASSSGACATRACYPVHRSGTAESAILGTVTLAEAADRSCPRQCAAGTVRLAGHA
jgi:hypothetical protein